MKSRWSITSRFFYNRVLQAVLLVLMGMIAGAIGSRFLPGNEPNAALASEVGTRMKSGPWGELYCVPFNIAAPDELLPIRTIEEGGTHWLFKNFTLSELTHLLDSVDLPDTQQNALLDPAIARISAAGIELAPTPEMVVALPAKARQVIYRQLAQFPENRSLFSFIHKSTLGNRFDGSGVSHQTLALFHTLCCEHGDYLVFGGLPAMLAELPAYEEKVRFMKALTRQRTMLLRLRMTSDTDLAGLSAYWDRGCWTANTRTLLESVRNVPGGSFMNVVKLLPPQPSAQLYDYPISQSASVNGTLPQHDCHWTSLNFFRETASVESVNPAAFAKEIAAHYSPSTGDPRYGDILILTKPDGDIVHSAVFIADDVVFTKNGATAIYPWMFSTIPDLLKQYSFLAPDGQQLALRYFRNKDL